MPNNRRQSSIQARQAANLDRLNDFGAERSEFDFADVLPPLERAVGDFINRIKENIEAQGMNLSGEINDISSERQGNGIVVFGHPYLMFQDRGVNGSENKTINDLPGYTDKMPPLDMVKTWADARGLTPYEGQTQEQMYFALQRSIFKNGIPAKHIVSNEIDKLVEDAAEFIAGFVADNIQFNNL